MEFISFICEGRYQMGGREKAREIPYRYYFLKTYYPLIFYPAKKIQVLWADPILFYLKN